MVLNVFTLDGKEVLVEDEYVASIPAFQDIATNRDGGNLTVPVTSDILVSLCTWIGYVNLASSVEELQNFYVQYYDHNIQQLNDLLSAARSLRFQSFLDVYETIN